MTNYKAGQREFARWLTGKGIRLTKVVDDGLKRDETGWDHFAWTMAVEQWRGAEPTRYEFPFRQGTAHTTKPTLVDLLSSLLRDVETVVSELEFEDWAISLGYDDDSIKAKKLYEQIVDTNAKLAKLFQTTDLDAILDEARPLMEAAGL